jgi:transcriptional regulator
MYVPAHFNLSDEKSIAEIIGDYNFALLVTRNGESLQASHLPFLTEGRVGPKGRLIAHMARPNPQWRDFAGMAAAGHEALVIFQGPHAYVSPKWYGPVPAVPTWNYVAVHVCGHPRIIDAPDAVRQALDRLVDHQEGGRDDPWTLESQADDFLDRMQRGIVAFEIDITRIEAKAKLGQNHPPEKRTGAAEALAASADPQARVIAQLMTDALAADQAS